jgi:hypothetical protein
VIEAMGQSLPLKQLPTYLQLPSPSSVSAEALTAPSPRSLSPAGGTRDEGLRFTPLEKIFLNFRKRSNEILEKTVLYNISLHIYGKAAARQQKTGQRMMKHDRKTTIAWTPGK